jgi:uncharacterized protein (TIGR02996 family)
MNAADGEGLYQAAVASRGGRTELLIYADWLEDCGRPQEAHAHRWAAARRKWPYITAGGRDVRWMSVFGLGMRAHRPWHVPQNVYQALPPGKGWKKYNTFDEAMRALALALSELHADWVVPR